MPKALLYINAIVLLMLAVAVQYPYLDCYVDPDATSYFRIIEYYTNGDYSKAVNGYWSPLSLWLCAALIKCTGCPAFLSAVIVNTAAAIGALGISIHLFRQFADSKWHQFLFAGSFALFWAYTVYMQLFCDVWQAFFLLLLLQLLLKKAFYSKAYWWLLYAFLTALAYYAKAYSLYIAPVFLVAALIIAVKKGEISLKKSITVFMVAFPGALLFTAPWIYCLYDKYGFLTAGYSGKLNMSWYLVGTQEFKDSYRFLIPPTYPGSVFYFEDPIKVQGTIRHFYDSPALFVKQLQRVLFNAFSWVKVSNHISPFYFFIWLASIVVLVVKKWRAAFTQQQLVLIAVFLLCPLGYWLIWFDVRFFWLTVPLSAIIAYVLFRKLPVQSLTPRIFALCSVIFYAAYLAGPFADIRSYWNSGKEEKAAAEQLKELGISGSFVSNIAYGPESKSLLQLAFFSNSSCYYHGLYNCSEAELVAEANNSYQVRYFFYFYKEKTSAYQLYSADGTPFPELSGNKIKGLKVFDLQAL